MAQTRDLSVGADSRKPGGQNPLHRESGELMIPARPTEPSSAAPWSGIAGPVLSLWVLWLVPSLGQLVKVTDLAGAVALAIVALAGLCLLLLAARSQRLRPTRAWFLALCAVAVALFAVLYPLATSGRFGGGSDRDDALNDALRSLVAGHYPYAAMTYLGNPPTPMPGALLLARPFQFLGNAALQNLFWVPAFLLWCRTHFREPATAWIAGLVVVVVAPQALDDFVVGGDFLVNALYVAIVTDWCIRTQRGERSLARACSAILLAVAVSSRPIYAVSLVIVAGHVWQVHGAARCLRLSAVCGVVVLALNLPFYLHDPTRFPTAHVLGKLDAQPGAALVKIMLPALGLAVAALASRWRLAAERPLDLLALSLAVMLYPPFLIEALGGVPLRTWMWTASFSLPVTVLGTLAVLHRFERQLSSRISPAASWRPS